MFSFPDYIREDLRSKPYFQYVYDVLNDIIVAPKTIKQACERMIAMIGKEEYYFDEEQVDKYIKLVSKLKHFTGIHSGKPFLLLPWQQWVFANVYGIKERDTSNRVIQNALVVISRKNGKTALAAAMGIIGSLEEDGAEVDLIANSRQQATIAFDMCKNFTHSADPKASIFKKYRDSIQIPKKHASINVRASDAMTLDGWNSSVFILDEGHAMKDWSLYNVMKSSQGMREQPLAIMITTAGFLLQGYPLFELVETCKDILNGIKDDDSQFAAIYMLDDGDDWQDESLWPKCCPSLDQTVKRKYLRDQVKAAINTPSLETGVKTKNFNMFCQSKNIWIPDQYLRPAMQKVSFDDFRDEDCYMGVDLSAVNDLSSFATMFPPNEDRAVYPDKFVFFPRIFVPSSALEESVNCEQYKEWKRRGYAEVTPGNVVDYDYILLEQKKIYDSNYLLAIAYDSWNATQWAINATSEGMPLEPYSQALGNFNRPTKFFEMLIRQGKLIIAANPAVRWCFNNVELKIDFNENCKPVKADGDNSKKIDPVIAMVEALGIYLEKTHFSDGQVLTVSETS